MNNMKHNYNGGYHCGYVKVTIEGKPLWNVNCHSNWCQITSGNSFRSFVLFDEENIEFAGQTPNLQRQKYNPRKAND